MLFASKTVALKNGKEALLRSPAAEDAAPMMDFLRDIAGETPFILRYPEECTETPEQEAAYLAGINQSPGLMIVALVDGRIAGNCQLLMNKRIKTRHRAAVAIGIRQEYWNLGIGTAMFQEMIAIARAQGILQIELEFAEGNTRARALYEKMGFAIVAQQPNAIRLRDGSFLREYIMVKEL